MMLDAPTWVRLAAARGFETGQARNTHFRQREQDRPACMSSIRPLRNARATIDLASRASFDDIWRLVMKCDGNRERRLFEGDKMWLRRSLPKP